MGGGVVGLVASPIIWNTLYDTVYWSQNWGWIPRLHNGNEEYIPTISKLCPSGTGVRVRLVDGNPVRSLGNPANAMSRGSLTALAAAEPQLMVSAARVKTPLKRSGDGAYVAISWEEAEQLLKNNISAAGANLACVSGDPTTSINEVLSAICNTRGGNFYFMPSDEQAAAKAWHTMGGQGRLGYDIENSDFVLSVGANFLENWGTVARNRRAFSAARPTGLTPGMKVAYAGPVRNNTAVAADWWLPTRHNTEMIFLLGVASLIVKSGRPTYAPGLSYIADLVEPYTPEYINRVVGVPQHRLQHMADNLLSASKPLVIVGSDFGAGLGTAPVMAGILLNQLLGRVGKEGNLVDLPWPTKVLAEGFSFRETLDKDLISYSRAVADGGKAAPAMLMLYDANPVYSLPPDSGFEQMLDKAGFSVAMASFMSETCAKCDLVLPAAMGLECFDDVYTPYGSGAETYAIARPVVEPKYQSRSAGDLALALAQELGLELGVEDMPHLIEQKSFALSAGFRSLMENGEVYVNPRRSTIFIPFYNHEAIAANLPEAPVEESLYVAPVTVLGMGTSRTGIPPFATKLITDYQLTGEYSVAQMNAGTAGKLGVRNGDKLRLTQGGKAFTVVASVYEGVCADTLALCTGLGHTAFDEFSQNKGMNFYTLTSLAQEESSGLWVWNVSGVSAARA